MEQLVVHEVEVTVWGRSVCILLSVSVVDATECEVCTAHHTKTVAN